MEGLSFKNRELKYKGHRVKVYEDTLVMPGGEEVYYDYVENRNGSGVLLVDSDGKLLFVKQYRNVTKDIDIEIPAGCVEKTDYKTSADDFSDKENAFYLCALREAEEETGFIPGKLIFINYIIASVGLFSERTAVYIGTDLKTGKENPDPDEFIDVVRLSLEEAVEYVYSGKINDSKTIIAILAYKDLKDKM
ncbi:MAG: NUDIX hydrolase [Eubacterium sp.]|nr:NUDIX hydrolase [Eubacterium sp.]